MAAAASESALLHSPRLFSSFGIIRGSDIDPEGLDSARGDLVLNFRAGLEVSPTRMYAGSQIEERARADCGRIRAELALQAASGEVRYDGQEGLAARASVLRQALPTADSILADAARKLDAAQLTLQSYMATRQRVESLKKLLSDTEREQVRLPESPAVPHHQQLVDALRFWERRREAAAARVRRSEAFDVRLRGGYDELIAVPQRVPAFASVNVSFVPGWLWQHDDDERSVAAAGERAEHRVRALRAALIDSQRRLDRQYAVAERHLAEVSAGVAELESRYAQLQYVKTPTALDLMEYLWFELVRARSELAFARAELSALHGVRRDVAASLGLPGAAPPSPHVAAP